MVHTYHISGMTCNSCVDRGRRGLLSVQSIDDVTVSLKNETVTLTMSHHIELEDLQQALEQKYQISEFSAKNEKPSWLTTYKPVLLIFFYLTIACTLLELLSDNGSIQSWMRHFMAGFFLVFSFFKMLNLKGFKNTYVMYDLIAKRFPVWAYIYAFIELILGLAFLVNLFPILSNIIALTVMSISIIGVLQTVFDKKRIQCACLGDVFKLPMSTVTIFEDGLMILMSLSMLLFALP